MNNPNCYKCVHRRSLPGSAHSRCCHPSVNVSPRAEIFGLIGKRLGLTTEVGEITEHQITATGDPHGVANGWFLWPVNFDPVWLVSCDGFEARETAEVTGYSCKSCGRVAELSKGFLEWFCTGGDGSQEFLATDCCSALFLDQYGNEYQGDNRPEEW